MKRPVIDESCPVDTAAARRRIYSRVELKGCTGGLVGTAPLLQGVSFVSNYLSVYIYKRILKTTPNARLSNILYLQQNVSAVVSLSSNSSIEQQSMN